MHTDENKKPFLGSGNAKLYIDSRDTFDAFHPSERWAIETAAFEGATIMEVGCNHGGLLNALKEKHGNIRYTGIDGSPAAIDVARRLHPNDEFIADFFPTQNIGDRVFDAIFLFSTFYHVEDWKTFLMELSNRAHMYIAIDLSLTWEFPTVTDKDVSYQYYLGDGGRAPRTVINVLEFVNFCFTEKVGAGKVEFIGTRPKTDGAMTAVPLDKQFRGVAIIEKDTTGLPFLGGITIDNDPDIVEQLDLSKYRFPNASMTIDGVKTQIYPRPPIK